MAERRDGRLVLSVRRLLPWILLLALCLSPRAERVFASDAPPRFPITSAQLAGYYVRDPVVTEFRLHPANAGSAAAFTEEEMRLPRQGHFFGLHAVDSETRYCEVGRFRAADGSWRLVLYNNRGEADTVCLNIELLGYDEKGVAVDALLLENCFGYEDIERFTQFEINEDTVSIDYYVVYSYYDGDFDDPIPNPRPELFCREQYRFANGRFELVRKREWEPVSWRKPGS